VAAKNFWNCDSGFPELNEIVAHTGAQLYRRDAVRLPAIALTLPWLSPW
jgi:hypothetical protein